MPGKSVISPLFNAPPIPYEMLQRSSRLPANTSLSEWRTGRNFAFVGIGKSEEVNFRNSGVLGFDPVEYWLQMFPNGRNGTNRQKTLDCVQASRV